MEGVIPEVSTIAHQCLKSIILLKLIDPNPVMTNYVAEIEKI